MCAEQLIGRDRAGAYEVVFSRSLDPDDLRRMAPLGTRDPRRCRFCLGAEAPLTFKQEAHVIPAAFGNRELFSWEECDRCNARGSQFEDALSKRLSLTRAMSRIAGRGGAPKHRFGNYPSYVQSARGANRVIVSRVQGDTTLQIRRTPDGVRYIARVPRYRPMNIAKALARMAIFVAPEAELTRLEHARQWLRDEVPWMPTTMQGFVPGPGLRHITLIVERRADLRDTDTPLFRVLFAFSTAIQVLYIPDTSWMLPDELTLPELGESPYPPHKLQWTRERLLADQELPPYNESIGVTIPALEGVPVSPADEIRAVAHARWETRGRGDGRDVEDWLAAEEDLLLVQLRQFGGAAVEE